MFRKCEYEDLDEDVQFRSDRSSWNLLQFVVIVLAAFGGALFFLVLWFTYLTIRHEIYQAANNAAVLAASAPAPAEAAEHLVIQLAKGAVEGKRMNTREGREYLAFLGIPYAKPPLGKLRFQPPVEEDAWNGTLTGTEFKPRCIQKKSSRSNSTIPVVGSEDCLYLNVFTPNTLNELNSRRGRDTKLPVMIYIHGGIGGAFGHVERNGAEYLLDENVILVTHHYRLGVLGNLNTMDRFARGNQGLKDTVMVLKWIQNNIDKFGGDPTRVTLFGESYGSMSTTMHLISSMSNGLFQRAICQSGSILMPGLLTQNTLEKAHILGSKLNCTTASKNITTQELVSCLQAVDAETIILQSHEAPLGQSLFTMSVEPDVESADDTFLPDLPLNLYLNGTTINKMPVMMGTTSAELLGKSLSILSSPDSVRLHNQNLIQSLVKELDLGIASAEPEKLAMTIRDFYLGSANISASVERNLTFMYSDRSYTHPVSVSANFQYQANSAATPARSGGRGRSQNTGDVYLYQFNYPVNMSYAQSVYDKYESDDFLGVGHADELQFLFPYEPFPLIPVEHKDFNFSRMLVRIWTSFADSGVPEGASKGTEWTPITGVKPDGWFRLEAKPKMITNEDGLANRLTFWDSLNLTELYI